MEGKTTSYNSQGLQSTVRPINMWNRKTTIKDQIVIEDNPMMNMKHSNCVVYTVHIIYSIS